MSKLLPPIIEGTIPAFYSSGGTVNVTVPFTMNRAVSISAVKGIKLKIKTLQSSMVLGDQAYDAIDFFLSNNYCYAQFEINAQNLFKEKQFYKFQIAYVNTFNEVGNYSGVAVGKYTVKPRIYIDGLNLGTINYHTHSYTGVYETEDNTETVRSYEFILLNNRNEIYFTSGELIHNSLNDEDLLKSFDICTISQDLNDEIYYLQYKVKTINNIELESDKYILTKSLNIDMDVKSPVLTAMVDNNEGCISLSFISDSLENSSIDANFAVYRSDEDHNYLNWEQCYCFSINDSSVNQLNFWQDYTVEHEKKYIYAIAQFNNEGLYSNKIESNLNNNKKSVPVSVSFDDIFLYDGLYNMKIKFNPKISSFKHNKLESKIETIGSQYPFIFKNGSVSYKEFPISGLITYLMDTSYYASNISRIKTPSLDLIDNFLSTDLTSQNIYKERMYKLDMLSWLTNGRPKLFRSPTEGNYLVRLLNVSLSPMDQLGRMLHTFNCTAYEIADFSYENMNLFNITGLNDTKTIQNTLWNTIPLKDLQLDSDINILENIIATTIRFYDMQPGQKILIEFADAEDLEIVIGQTGMYRLEYNQYKITGVKLLNNFINNQGYITYSFNTIIDNNFKEFNDIEMINIPLQQFIGKTDIIQEISTVTDKHIMNSKIEIVSIPRVHCYKRPTQILRQENDNYYYFNNIYEESWDVSKANEYTLYPIVEQTINNFTKEYKIIDFKVYKDGELRSIVPDKKQLESFQQDLFNIQLGNSILSLDNTYDFSYDTNELSLLKSNNKLKFKINDGVIAEISYSLKSQTYILESNPIYLIKNKKEKYLQNKNALDEVYAGNSTTVYHLDETTEIIPARSEQSDIQWWQQISRVRKLIDDSYDVYIATLENERQRQKIIEGFVEGG